MATKKTTTASGTTGRTAGKTTAPRKTAATKAPRKATGAKAAPKASAKTKSDPVVLDPPKSRAAPKATNPSVVIDAKAVEVPDTKATEKVAPKATAQPSAAKKPVVEDKKPEVKPDPKPEVKPDPKPDPKQAAEQKPQIAKDPAAPAKKQASRALQIGGLVIGGAAAAAIGYFVAVNTAPPLPPDRAAEIATLKAEMAEKTGVLEARIAELEAGAEGIDIADVRAELDAAKQAMEREVSALAERITGAEERLSGMLEQLEAARERLASTVAETGAGISEGASDLLARYDAEIATLKQQLAEQIANAEGLKTRIEEVSDMAGEKLTDARDKVSELSETVSNAARDMDLTVATERLRLAVETGKSYAVLLAQIASEAAVEIPKVLLDKADEGVIPMLQLQQEFPAAARRALKASVQAEAGEGFGAQIGAFLKSQLGARSLEEKDGDDPDAILSRAEAALGRKELPAAVDLVRQLPEAGVAEMADWLAAAEGRLKVGKALDEFTDMLGKQN